MNLMCVISTKILKVLYVTLGFIWLYIVIRREHISLQHVPRGPILSPLFIAEGIMDTAGEEDTAGGIGNGNIKHSMQSRLIDGDNFRIPEYLPFFPN